MNQKRRLSFAGNAELKSQTAHFQQKLMTATNTHFSIPTAMYFKSDAFLLRPAAPHPALPPMSSHGSPDTHGK